MDRLNAITGVLLGTAVGDALGLPYEGLRPTRIARRLGNRPLTHSMVLGRGLLSDDTEHTFLVGRALVESQGDVQRFTRSFARQLRRWAVGLPPGVGLATLRGVVCLLVGVSPRRSGVHSAGNGPAMRSAIVGVCANDDGHLVDLVRASTRMTHTDKRAEDGAVLVARLARQLSLGAADSSIVASIRDVEFRERVGEAWTANFENLEEYRHRGGYTNGVSGFIVHTVPAAVYCALRVEGAANAVEQAVRMGGDTDTTAAIVGALVGAREGVGAFPRTWVEGIADWPLSTETLGGLARALHGGGPVPPHRWVAALPRNLGMVALIVAHISLRLLGR